MRCKSQPVCIRLAVPDDIPEVAELYRKVYPEGYHYSNRTLCQQIRSFPEGVFVALDGQRIVGYCATILKTEKSVWSQHTWMGITGGGCGAGHEPEGRWLYGYEIFVDPDQRRRGIGCRLYLARASLCRRLRLKGIAICGRLPLLKTSLPRLGSVQNYVKAAQEERISDPTFTFQARQGFQFQRVMPGYLPLDEDSLGYAAFMVWRNSEAG